MASRQSNGPVRYDGTDVEAVIARTLAVLDRPITTPRLFEVVEKAGDLFRDFYPPKRRNIPFRFATDKSRRYFWWRVSQGAIRVPYQRTDTLRKGTVLEAVEISPQRFVVKVTIDRRIAPYAQFVVGPLQVPGHRDTGWSQLYTKVSDAVPGMTKRVGNDYGRTLSGYIIKGRL